MKIKKTIIFLSMIFIISLLTGCQIVYTYDLTSADKIHVISDMYISEDEFEQYNLKKSDDYELVTLEDGKRYYKYSESEDISVYEVNASSSGGVISRDILYLPVNTVEEQEEAAAQNNSIDPETLRSVLGLKIVFVFPEEVVDTNGTLSEDKKTVTFIAGDTGNAPYYAYTARGKSRLESDKTAPVISGLKQNVYYKSNNVSKLSVSDETALASVTCNGYKIEKCEKGWNFSTCGKFKQGKNVVVATDLSGNKTSFTLLIDDKSPTVKNLKNNSVKKCTSKNVVFYVKDADSGLKKITYSKNSQKFKTIPKKNIKLVKSGKYKGYYKVTIKCRKSCKLRVKILDNCGNFKNVSNVKIVVK